MAKRSDRKNPEGKRRVRHALALLALTALALVGWPDGADAKAPRRIQQTTTLRAPVQLWRRYPLQQVTTGTTTQQVVTRTTTQPQGISPQTNRTAAEGKAGTPRAWVWLMVGLAIALAAAVVATVSSYVHNGGGVMSRRNLTGGKDRKANDDVVQLTEPSGDAATRVESYFGSEPAAPGHDAESTAGDELQRAVGHVSSVLRAAEEAASLMKAEAREDAERLRGETQAWAEELRESAQREAAETRAAAASDSERILAEAQAEAASFASQGRSRRDELTADIARAEARLRQLVTGLQELAAQLDKLLSTPPTGRAAQEADDLLVDVAPARAGEGVPS